MSASVMSASIMSASTAMSSSAVSSSVADSTATFIEAIKEHRVRNGAPEFLVRWSGHAADDDEWFPRGDLVNEDAELVDRRDDLGVGGGQVGGDDRLELREHDGGVVVPHPPGPLRERVGG